MSKKVRFLKLEKMTLIFENTLNLKKTQSRVVLQKNKFVQK